MTRLLLAGGLAAVALAVAAIVNRRKPAPPTQPTATIPTQLDRADFTHPDAPWLVALFSSSTCDSCVQVWTAVRALENDQLAVQDISFQADKAMHKRYNINSVPTTVVADAEGVVKASWVGAFPTAEIWSAIDAARA